MVCKEGQSSELHLELGLELELLFSPTAIVLSALFDSACLIGQIRLTVVGGTIEISRPTLEIALRYRAA